MFPKIFSGPFSISWSQFQCSAIIKILLIFISLKQVLLSFLDFFSSSEEDDFDINAPTPIAPAMPRPRPRAAAVPQPIPLSLLESVFLGLGFA